ncbi:MAG: hypothetical protein HYV63_33410 [Candidatus Schekmanbacteria bacterium]|nr:hypothetical protein [Candidatus Schekmanbacteria bacterium]
MAVDTAGRLGAELEQGEGMIRLGKSRHEVALQLALQLAELPEEKREEAMALYRRVFIMLAELEQEAADLGKRKPAGFATGKD